MDDELEVCTAAFFRNRGKDVITVMELIMNISLDLKWMDPTTASRFVKLISSDGLVSETSDGLLRAAPRLRDIEVPVAYKPSRDLMERLKAGGGAAPADEPVSDAAPGPEAAAPGDGGSEPVFPRLMGLAAASGMERGRFVSECNRLVKRFNVDMEVAALLVLRDAGIDTGPYRQDVLASVLSK